MTVTKRATWLLSVACATVVVCSATAHAASPSPGWSLTATSEPTNFNLADTQNEERELIVTATGGSYTLRPQRLPVSEVTAPIAWNAAAKSLQEALEALPGVGEHDAEVTGPAGGPYDITWTGALSGSGAGPLSAEENNLENGAEKGTVEDQSIRNSQAFDRYVLTIINTGSRSSEGEVMVKDELPAGMVATGATIEGLTGGAGSCTGSTTITCTYAEPVAPNGEVLVTIKVALTNATPTTVTDKAELQGGGGAPVSLSKGTKVNLGPASFGLQNFFFEANGADGQVDALAGDHPYQVTTTLNLNTIRGSAFEGLDYNVPQDLRNVSVTLPLGLTGNLMAAPQCPQVDLANVGEAGERTFTNCPPASRVGTARLVFSGGGRPPVSAYPVFNLEPDHGYPVELGFDVSSFKEPIYIYGNVVPSPHGYVVRFDTFNVLHGSTPDIEGATVTIFGNPQERDGAGGHAAFLTNPSHCTTEPLTTSLEVTSWSGGVDRREATAYPSIIGCDLLQDEAAFDPILAVAPSTTQADSPAGYEVDVKVPQAPPIFGALATADLRNATVTLPPGVAISPAAASGPTGLEGCSPEQFDLLGTELGEGHPGGNGSPYDDGAEHAAPGHCPEHSQVGTVKVMTPILPDPLEGHVYVAQPKCGGSGQPACTEAAAEEGQVFGLYVEVAGNGVIIKLAGTVEVGGHGPHSAATGLLPGQVRTRFLENPQQPVEDVKFVFSRGERSPLANPQSCGVATTTSEFEPWSAPQSGPNATPFSSFTVTGCGNPQPFAPAFTAGTLTPSAGVFSPFVLTLSRHDGEQDLSGVEARTPPGLLGALSAVTLCGEPQAAAGACGEESLIGHVHVAAGSGSQPLWQEGRAYLTASYKGAPFGLSIVTPAKAGPFNLGNVIVRAAIHVDPRTAQITVASDPFPQLADGVPLRIKTVSVTVDRPGFMFNPTNCAQQQVTGTVTSAQGTSVNVASPFAVAGCANLPFKPSFSASTKAKTSKANGASLTVKVGSGPGQANVAKVHLTFPKQLPARLTTLQKACTEAQFNTNPAGCPPGSVIGRATAHTPVLNSPLTGPIYLVSHGGAAFPDAVVVLQGEGVLLYLDGSTNIKKGITSSTFNSVPDAPISTFEAILPEGPHSAFAANIAARAKGNMCGQSLTMPTTLTGQNVAVVNQITKIGVTGCAKKKSLTRAQKLAAALKVCHKDKNHGERAGCERQAHRKYGPAKTRKRKKQ
jgi:hypothetical protein